jgi:ElaA protein
LRVFHVTCGIQADQDTSIDMSEHEVHWQCLGFEALNTHELYGILHLRQQVFIVEQDCIYQDLDNLDQLSLHLCANRADELLAYLRCLPPGLSYEESSMGRIVTSPVARELKLGRELVRRGIELNFNTWPDSDILIGAQAYLENFYREFGFETVTEPYDEDGISHIKMLLRKKT